jgi:hypothetical protein
VNAEERDRRRCSFGGIADTYERYRPGYPMAAIDWLLGPALRLVLDLAAGTGKLTEALLEAGHEVVAVEPDPMRAFAGSARRNDPAGSVSRSAPDRRWTRCVSQAHWFDPRARFCWRGCFDPPERSRSSEQPRRAVPLVAEFAVLDGLAATGPGESPSARATPGQASRVPPCGLDVDASSVVAPARTVTWPGGARRAARPRAGSDAAVSLTDRTIPLPYAPRAFARHARQRSFVR